jgi:glycine cleavage system aminomethyltransferase T
MKDIKAKVMSLFAVQGPNGIATMQKLTDFRLNFNGILHFQSWKSGSDLMIF